MKAENQKNIKINGESWILIKVQCVIYQWIRFNKLYKIMEIFILISESFFELTTIFLNNSCVGFMQAWTRGGVGICADQRTS